MKNHENEKWGRRHYFFDDNNTCELGFYIFLGAQGNPRKEEIMMSCVHVRATKKKSWNFWCEKAKKFPVSRETKAYQKKKAVCYDAIRWFFVIYTTPLCFQRFNQSVEGNLDEENNEKSSVKQEMICF